MIFLLIFLLSVPSAWADEWSSGKVIEGATSCANYFTAPGGGCLKSPAKGTVLIESPLNECNAKNLAPAGQRCWIYTDPVLGPQKIVRNDHDVVCLDKMETAMRAAEKYRGFIPDIHDPTAQTSVKEYREMLVLWESTKRDCWRQP